MTDINLVVLLIIFGLLLFSTGLLSVMLMFLSRDTGKIPELLTRVTSMERSVQSLESQMTNIIPVTGSQEIWQSADGKYIATNFEDLLNQMVVDPDSPLTQQEIDVVKSIFEKIIGMPPSDDDDEKESYE